MFTLSTALGKVNDTLSTALGKVNDTLSTSLGKVNDTLSTTLGKVNDTLHYRQSQTVYKVPTHLNYIRTLHTNFLQHPQV